MLHHICIGTIIIGFGKFGIEFKSASVICNGSVTGTALVIIITLCKIILGAHQRRWPLRYGHQACGAWRRWLVMDSYRYINDKQTNESSKNPKDNSRFHP